MDRRTFLQTLAAGGGAFALSDLGIVDSLTDVAEAKSGTKVVTIGNSEGNPDTLDMLLTPAFVTRQNAGPCHSFLVNLTAKGGLSPDMATRWEIVTPRRIRFHIRQGMTYHNGRKVVASDVKRLYDHVMKKSTASTFRDSLLPYLHGFEVKGRYVVDAVLKQPFPAFLAMASQVPIYPPGSYAQQKTHPLGAGPFRFKQWQKDNFVELTKNKSYWNPHVPHIDKLRILPQPEDTTLRNGFLSGQTDILFNPSWTDKQALEGAGGKVIRIQLFGFQFVVMNCGAPPFNNPLLRRALEKGLDRATLATVAQGAGTPVSSILFPANSPLYPHLPAWKRDVAGAKALISQGKLQGTAVEVLIVDLPFSRPYAPVMLANLSEIGLKPKTTILSVADFLSRVYSNKTYQIGITGDASPPDPSLFLNRYLTTAGSTNVMKYSNHQVDALLNKAAKIYNPAQRRSLYTQAMRIVVNDAPAFPLFPDILNTAYKSYIHGWDVKSNADFSVAGVTTSK